jgi:hypothetical protein
VGQQHEGACALSVDLRGCGALWCALCRRACLLMRGPHSKRFLGRLHTPSAYRPTLLRANTQVTVGATLVLLGHSFTLPLTLQRLQVHTRLRLSVQVGG